MDRFIQAALPQPAPPAHASSSRASLFFHHSDCVYLHTCQCQCQPEQRWIKCKHCKCEVAKVWNHHHDECFFELDFHHNLEQLFHLGVFIDLINIFKRSSTRTPGNVGKQSHVKVAWLTVSYVCLFAF